jgi:transcription elongation factor Elf1
MAEFQEDYSFQCPYCASPISILIDLTGGREQSFTIDCEICCRPIAIAVEVNEEGVANFSAERELS